MNEIVKSKGVRIDPQFKPKAGVFFNKDAKILELQRQNSTLRQLLAAEMQMFDKLSAQLQQNRAKLNSVQSQNKLYEIQEMMCRQSISKMEEKLRVAAPYVDQTQHVIANIQLEVDQLNEALEAMLLEDQSSKNLIRRYRQEVKMEKTMAKSQKNLNNVCESLRKNHQSYLKNVDILKNKLQSKKKYLAILTKKQQQTRKEENKLQITSPVKQEKRSQTSSTSTRAITSLNEQLRLNEPKEKVACKADLKNLNELIRKKNAILAKKK